MQIKLSSIILTSHLSSFALYETSIEANIVTDPFS